MKTRFLAAGAVLVLITCIRSSANVVNGSFEDGVAGWNVVGGPPVQSTVVSPFASSYGTSHSSLLLPGTPNALSGGTFLSQSLAPLTTDFRLSFDFRFGAAAPVAWYTTILGADNRGVFTLNAYAGGNLYCSGDVGAVAPLDATSWYHLEADVSFAGGTYSGSITRFGGDTIAWSTRPLTFSDTGGAGGLEFVPGSCPVFPPQQPCTLPPMYLDNVSITPVPEPAPILLLGLILGGFAFCLRKQQQRTTPVQGSASLHASRGPVPRSLASDL